MNHPADADAAVVSAIVSAHRDEWSRIVGALVRRFGDLDLAEESTAEAFAIAVERWPIDGVPPNPGGWLTVAANRKAIDRVRRERRRDDKYVEAATLHDPTPADPAGPVDDDRLRLLFLCCHPALGIDARVALTLRMVGGLTVPEIARAFLVPTTTIEKRITRAKAKITAARIPFRPPTTEDLVDRLSGVLAVVYLVFNEGHLATGPDTPPVRHDLTSEAVRLARLVRALVPGDGEAAGLLALLLLTEARRPARLSNDGELVALADQDRGRWDHALIAEGHGIVRERLASSEPPGRYQLLAAINAVHTDAASMERTDWTQIVQLYDQLARLDPSPIVVLNRAVAVAELDGPEVALAAIERLDGSLVGYRPFHVARAEMLRRLGRVDDAVDAYGRAIALGGNPAEIRAVERCLHELTSAPDDPGRAPGDEERRT